MSASLVGSEMCIRDSPTGAAPWAERGAPPMVQHPSEGGPERALKGLCGCLLYTSDAADDM
eukprot:3006811-Alexandrium_andersonii.AAC.1